MVGVMAVSQCVLVPILLEACWLMYWLPIAMSRRDDDEPASVSRESILVGLVFAIYHWPISLVALAYGRRLPTWVGLAGMVGTGAIHASALLWIVDEIYG